MMILTTPPREEETTGASPYHVTVAVAEHHPARSESLQPHTDWTKRSRPGSEPPSVEAYVYNVATHS